MIHRIDSVNPDIDDRVIKPNQARAAKNLRFSVSSTDENLSGGILVYGNTKLNFTPPAGTNKVIGTCNDYENQVIYFALYNEREISSGPLGTIYDYSHGIYQIQNDIVTLIVQGDWLNFTSDMDVSIAYIDNKLYWTDGVNQPKMINILKATNNLVENGAIITYPNNYQEWMYTQIKRPGALPLYVAKLYAGTDPEGTSYRYFSTVVDVTNSFDFIPNTNDNFTEEGHQFSYYYIYDNYEESRLAPISNIVFDNKNLKIILPKEEFDRYIKNNNVIKSIVFVYRKGNDGSWNVLKKIDNNASNYPNNFELYLYDGTKINYTETISLGVENIIYSPVLPVDTDITDSYFDAVPIQSTCNTIAINRIFHSNYTIDYDNWDDISLELEVVRQYMTFTDYTTGLPIKTTQPRTYIGQRTFMFGKYKAGIELLDDYGRRIGVIGAKEFTIPKPTYTRTLLDYGVKQDLNTLSQNLYPYSDADLCYEVNYKITGVLPSWVKSYRVVMTKNLSYTYFFKTQIRIFYWYSSDNKGDFISSLPIFYTGGGYDNWYPLNNIPSKDEKDLYVYEGFAFALDSDEPFIFNPEENNFVGISQEYMYDFISVLFPPNIQRRLSGMPLLEFKIDKYNGKYFFVKRPNADFPTVYNNNYADAQPFVTTNSAAALLSTFMCTEPPDNVYKPFAGDSGVPSRQNLAYQVYLYTKKKESEEVYYQNENTFFVPSDYTYGETFNSSGVLRGDCYLTNYKKTFAGNSTLEASFYNKGQVNNNFTNNNATIYCRDKPDNTHEYRYRSRKQDGLAFSMNPCNISSSIWSSSIGQPSIVNEKQKQTIAENNILPSGQIVLGSEINNLNRFNSIDAQSMPAENGPITATVITNTGQSQPGVMLALGTLGIQSIYLNAIQQTASNGESIITLSSNVLGSNRPLLGQFGVQKLRNITVTPESVVYWYSEVVNDFIRYTNAGMERLGKTYMFANYLRNNYNNNQSLFTLYDQVNDEAIIIPYKRNSVAFNEKYKAFQGERDYSDLYGNTPERGASLSTKHYMFLNGEIWVFKNGNPNNKFFDSNKAPEITIVTNEMPSIVKQWNQIKIFGPRPSFTECRSESSQNKYTVVPRDWYIERKNDYEAAIRRDANSGGILSGKSMESRVLYSTFVFDITGFKKLNFIEIKSNKSVVQ